MRFFKLSRINDYQLLEETINQKNVIEPIDTSIKMENLMEVSLKFSQKLAFRVYEDFLEEEIFQCEDGCLYVKTQLPEHESIYTYLLSYLDGVESMEPDHLRRSMITRLEKIQKIYKP